MTLEELVGTNSTEKKMENVSHTVEELLVAAQRRHALTVGVYESAKLMTVDPDSVVLCILATDEEDEGDIALQIHFTLLQAFCCDNDINILRLSGLRRLVKVLEQGNNNVSNHDSEEEEEEEEEEVEVEINNNNNVNVNMNVNSTETRDMHCILVTNPPVQPLQIEALDAIGRFCEESRQLNQWVPFVSLQDHHP